MNILKKKKYLYIEIIYIEKKFSDQANNKRKTQ